MISGNTGACDSLRSDIGFTRFEPIRYVPLGLFEKPSVSTSSANRGSLVEVITRSVIAIPSKFTRKVIENYRKRTQCINNEGCLLGDVILKIVKIKFIICTIFK